MNPHRSHATKVAAMEAEDANKARNSAERVARLTVKRLADLWDTEEQAERSWEISQMNEDPDPVTDQAEDAWLAAEALVKQQLPVTLGAMEKYRAASRELQKKQQALDAALAADVARLEGSSAVPSAPTGLVATVRSWSLGARIASAVAFLSGLVGLAAGVKELLA